MSKARLSDTEPCPFPSLEQRREEIVDGLVD